MGQRYAPPSVQARGVGRTLFGGDLPPRHCHDLHDGLIKALTEADQGGSTVTHAAQHDAYGVTQRVMGAPGHHAGVLMAEQGQMGTQSRAWPSWTPHGPPTHCCSHL